MDAFSIKGVIDVDNGPMKAGFKEAGSIVSGFGSMVASAGEAVAKAFAATAVAGIAAAGAGLGVATKQAADFEKTMSGVKAVSGASGEEMKTLQKLALQLGADTSFSAKESAQGIEELVKAGVSVGDIMGGSAKASLDLAAAGGVSVADAATLAADSMNMFSLKGKDMERVANQIAGAANASSIDVGQFKFSLEAAGAVAAAVGFSFEDTADAIAVMGQAGIKGSDAGTSLKQMMMGLQPQTDKQKTLFKELGLTMADGSNKFFDATGKIKDMSSVAQILQDATKGMTEQQKVATMETLFGSDAIRAGIVISKAGAAGFKDMADAIGKVSAADVANTRLDNLSGSVEKLTGSLSTVAITIGLGLTPGFKRLVDMATETVNAWIPTITVFSEKLPAAFDKLITSVQMAFGTSGIGKAAKDAASGFGGMSDAINGFASSDTKLMGWFGRVRQGFTDIGQIVGRLVGVDLDHTKAGLDTWMASAVAVFGIVKDVASTAFDAIMKAVPVVIGVFKELAPVVITIGKMFIENIGNTISWLVTDVVPPLVSIFRQSASFFITTLQPALAETSRVFHAVLGDTLTWLSDTVWPKLLDIAGQTTVFWTTTMLPAIQAVAGPLRTALGETISWIADTVWPKFLGAAKVVVDYFTANIAPMLPGIAKMLRDGLGTAMQWISDTGWPMLVAGARIAWSFLTEKVIPAVSSLIDWLREKLPPVIDGIMTAWKSISDRVMPIIEALFGGNIKDAISKAGDAFSDFGKLAIGWLSDQVAQIDWSEVWSVAKDVISSMVTWFVDIGGKIIGWLGDQVAKIDWWEVWSVAKDVTIRMADWFIDIGGKIIGWISDKVAEIDWWEVWQTAKDVTLKMADWFVDIATRFAGWIGDKVSEIDWDAVWLNVEDMTAAMQKSFTDEASKIDWKGVLNGAINATADMFAWIQDTIGNIDWKQIGTDTGTYFGDMFKDSEGKTDWKTVGESFSRGIGNMLGLAITSADAWSGFQQGLIDGFSKAVTGTSQSEAEGKLGDWFIGVLKGAWNAAVGAFSPGDTGASTKQSLQTSVPSGMVSKGVAAPWADIIRNASSSSGTPDAVIAAIMEIESTGRQDAQSPMNVNSKTGEKIGRAQGLMQVMPMHFGVSLGASGEATPEQLAMMQQPDTNVNKGAQILADNFKKYGSWDKAAAAYFGAIDSSGNITGGTDVTGTSGNKYVALFNAALERYKAGTVQLANLETAAKDTAATMPMVNNSVEDASKSVQDASQGMQDSAGKTADVIGDANKDVQDSVGKTASVVASETGKAGKALMGLGDTFTATSAHAVKTTKDQQSAVAASYDLMGSNSLKSVTQMKDNIKTQIADASGNIVTTTTSMSGKVIDQTATMSNGVQIKMSELVKGTTTSTEQLADGVKTIMTDIKGNTITTVTDMSGEVVSQTADMAAGGSQNAQKLGTEVTAAITGMAGSTVTVTRTMAGDLVSTIKDAAGGVVSQYRAMKDDVAGQAAILAQASAQTNGQIAAGADLTFNVIKTAAATGVTAYNGFGQAVDNAGTKVRQFNKDAGGIISGFTGDQKWLADHGFIPTGPGTYVPGKATGGGIMSGVPTWVGENGPELYFPGQNGSVMSNAQSMALMGNGGNIPTTEHVITVKGPSGETLAQYFVRGKIEAIKRGMVPSTVSV